MMCCSMLQVREKSTGKIYEVAVQCVKLGGRYVLRYNIGIDGYYEWTNICCIYDNKEFNDGFEVINDNYQSIRKEH